MTRFRAWLRERRRRRWVPIPGDVRKLAEGVGLPPPTWYEGRRETAERQRRREERKLEQANENRLALWQGEHEQRNRAIQTEKDRDEARAESEKERIVARQAQEWVNDVEARLSQAEQALEAADRLAREVPGGQWNISPGHANRLAEALSTYHHLRKGEPDG